MVRVDKLIKYSRDSSKVRKIIKQINKIKANTKLSANKKRISIKTYKKNLLNAKRSQRIKQSIKKSKVSKTHKVSKLHKQTKHYIKKQSLQISNMVQLPIIKADVNTTTNYVIAIPSYNRPDMIQTKTLEVLKQKNIDPSIIHIFVANKEQYDIYKDAIPSNLYGKIIIGLLGLKHQRNYITEYYPEGTHVVEMDDDISKIVQLVVSRRNSSKTSKSSKRSKSSKLSTTTKKASKHIKTITNLDAFFRHAFATCIKHNSFLWGVYPIANAYFMTDKVSADLRFIVGPMWGMINRHSKDLIIKIDEKEDVERTLQYWTKDGIVVRFNNISMETRYYKNKGGMQDEGKDRKVEALKSAHYLHKKYPKLTKLFLGKKSGVPEVKLVRGV